MRVVIISRNCEIINSVYFSRKHIYPKKEADSRNNANLRHPGCLSLRRLREA